MVRLLAVPDVVQLVIHMLKRKDIVSILIIQPNAVPAPVLVGIMAYVAQIVMVLEK